ncbi:hypothetical protein GGH96_001195 [Coemansia sp. RSA 1972]|nr:hypothetical protein GGH96_001195 [Coemansia sp. RSA 1972]
MNADAWDEEAEEVRLRDMEREWAANSETGPDYYKILNVSRHASAEQVRDSYKRLSLLFHPDRHHDAESREWAHRQFNIINRAYEVLTDPRSRAAYDQLGEEGVRLSTALGHKVQSPRDLQAAFQHYARCQRIEEIELWSRSNSEIAVDIDSTKLKFLSWMTKAGAYRANQSRGDDNCVKGIHMQHSFSADLATDLLGTVTGKMSLHGPSRSSNIFGTLKYTAGINSWASVKMSALPPYTVSFRGTHQLSASRFCTANVKQQTLNLLTPPSVSVSYGHVFGGLIGTLTMSTGNRYALGPFWANSPTRFGSKSSNKTVVIKPSHPLESIPSTVTLTLYNPSSEQDSFTANVTAGIEHSWVAGNYTRKLDDHFSITGGLGVVGLGIPMPRDSYFRIGDEHDNQNEPAAIDVASGLQGFADVRAHVEMTAAIDDWTSLTWDVEATLSTGVTVTITLKRLEHNIRLPILLTPMLELDVAAYTMLLPVVAALGLHYTVLKPRRRRAIQQRVNELKEQQRSQLHLQRLHAEETVRLLAPSVERSRAAARAADGLVIESALYGDLPFGIAAENSNSLHAALDHFWNSRSALSTTDEPRACDVTLALQSLITNNQLVIAGGGGKYSLPGFYDPSFGVEKLLFVRYHFRGVLHEVVVKDDEALAIPMKAHSLGSQL